MRTLSILLLVQPIRIRENSRSVINRLMAADLLPANQNVTLLIGPDEMELSLDARLMSENSGYLAYVLKRQYVSGKQFLIKLSRENVQARDHICEAMFPLLIDSIDCRCLPRPARIRRHQTARPRRLTARRYTTRLQQTHSTARQAVWLWVSIAGLGPQAGCDS
jgi:hypothetical protein